MPTKPQVELARRTHTRALAADDGGDTAPRWFAKWAEGATKVALAKAQATERLSRQVDEVCMHGALYKCCRYAFWEVSAMPIAMIPNSYPIIW